MPLDFSRSMPFFTVFLKILNFREVKNLAFEIEKLHNQMDKKLYYLCKM